MSEKNVLEIQNLTKYYGNIKGVKNLSDRKSVV